MQASLYRTVRLIRRFEERCIELVRSGDIIGGIHPYIGQEAIAAGVCATLRHDDIITSTHRGHGHVLAKGADPIRMLAELCGKETGLNRGRGGSMHAADFSKGIYGANGIVGAGGAIATGAAWAFLRQGSKKRPRSSPGGPPTPRSHQGRTPRPRVAVSFFGDGAVSQGVLLEAMNLAALWKVPVLFVCENNGYATTLTVSDSVAGTICGRASAFGIPSATVDGMDPELVYRAAAEMVDNARGGGGPSFLECTTYRFDAHHTWEHKARVRYRPSEEETAGRLRDPVEIAGARLPAEQRDEIDAEIEALLDQAVAFATTSPAPDPSTALDYLYGSAVLP